MNSISKTLVAVQSAKPKPTDFRVLQIGMSWFPEQAGNGLDRVFHALAQTLPETGVQISGVVVGSPRVARDTAGSIRAFEEESAPLVRRLLAARETIRSEVNWSQPDVVASHFALYTLPAMSHLKNLPMVVHFHGPWASESKVEGGSPLSVWLKSQIEKKVYHRANRFIVLSEAFRDVLVKTYHVDPELVRIVPGGADTRKFSIQVTKEHAREQLGWPVHRPIVLTVRRLARRMGLEKLLESAAIIRREIPEALILIVGKGPIRAELEERIQAHGLEANVRLLGFLPEGDLPLAYRGADLSIVPTTSLEGFGLTTVESLAAGTPVLVTPSGGLPEVVSDLAEELVCEGTSASDLADRIVPALKGELRLPTEEACRAYARAKYDWSAVAAKTRAVYEEVLV